MKLIGQKIDSKFITSSHSAKIVYIFVLIFSVQILYFSTILVAHEKTDKPGLQESKYSIKWIGQFSNSGDLSKSENITHRIFNFLFGSEGKALVRPISLLTIGSEQWIIMDQGNQNLIYLDQEKGDFFQLSELRLPSPVGICAASDAVIYYTDSFLNKIFWGNINDKKFRVLNDSLKLQRPTGIAYARQPEEIWIVETMVHQITVINPAGKVLRTHGRRGTSPGEFNFPTFIWIDKNGLVYIVDSMNYRIQILNLQGELVSFFGEAGDASGYFARPKGIATDSHGNIYVVDALFHTVQIFNRQGQFLSNFGEQGREPGQFWLPAGIYIDDQDRIYVADSYNSRIQIFQLVPGGMDEN